MKRSGGGQCYTSGPMKVSVVIPAYNEAQYLAGCLASLSKQTLSRSDFEVIVVDNGSTDGTPKIARAAESVAGIAVRLLEKPKTSISAVRNHGASQARGEVLAFLDADCLADPDWLEAGLRLAPEAGVWGAHYRIPEDATWVGRTWFDFQAKVVEGPATFLPGGDMFLRRRDFAAVGGFNEAASTSEDVELCARVRAAGMPVRAMPELAVIHLGTPRTLGRFYRQHRWHGQEVVRLFLKNLPSTKNLPLIFLSGYTFVMVGLVVVGFVTALVTHLAWTGIIPVILLLMPSFLLAARKVIATRSLSSLSALWMLYLVYFLARAAALRYVIVPTAHGGRVKT